MDSNRVSKECPECHNKTMFNIDGLKYFCNNCMYETPIENSESTKIVDNVDNQDQTVEKITDVVLDPEILTTEANLLNQQNQ